MKYCCSSIARNLMLNDNLRHLDVSVNNIQDDRVLVLMVPLVFPNCKLWEMELCGCFFTSDACQDIALILRKNSNLKSLELGSNNIGNAGMELLCDALKNPVCQLENIRLEEYMLNSYTAHCSPPKFPYMPLHSQTLPLTPTAGNQWSIFISIFFLSQNVI